MPAGRPPRWSKASDLQEAINAYFEDAKTKDEPIGILSLCDHASMSYDCFIDYENGSMDTETEEFSELCKKAKQKVMGYAEKRIYAHTAGATFQLVNLTRKTKEPYKNAQHQEVTGANGSPLSITLIKADKDL